MAKLLKVKAKKANLRGQKVSGVALGRMYLVNPQTSLLHLLDAKGTPAAKPGCHIDDAAEFRGFASTFDVFDVEKRPPPAPKKGKGKGKTPPPPPSAAGGDGETARPDSQAGEPSPPGASGPSAAEFREAELNAMSKTVLVRLGKKLKLSIPETVEELIVAIMVAETK